MLSRYSHRNLAWIDLEAPTREEAALIGEEFDLHPLITNEITARSERARADAYADSIYAVFHFPVRNRSTGRIDEAEIDFILRGDTLITTHYELIDPLHDFARMFEAGTHLERADIGAHAGVLFYLQMRELYKHTFFILAGVETMVREIEKDIFNGKEDAMVARLSKAAGALMDVRAALRSHKDTLRTMSQAAARLYGSEFANYMAAIEGDCAHVESLLEENRQVVQDLRRTNDSLLSAKTNAIMRSLTVVSVVLMPLNLTAFIFAMHSELLSLNEPAQLFAVFAAMAGMALSAILYFRSKKWL